MQRVLFIDFDGVLTSEAYTRQCILECRQENMFGIDWFDPSCVSALEDIVRKTHASIVISSSWRELGINKLRQLWESLSMPGRLLGITPAWVIDKKESILTWLDSHDCEYYLVIDDDDLNMENQLRTDARTGLTDNDVTDAIRILGYGLSPERMPKGEYRTHMRTTEEVLDVLKEYWKLSEEKYGIETLGLFGSYARGEQQDDSDIDVAVRLKRPSLLTLNAIWSDLEELFENEVDVISLSDRLGKRFKDEISKDIIFIKDILL